MTNSERPIIRHGSTVITVNGMQYSIRIMLVKYDYCIETYYQAPGHPYEFAYGVADFEGFSECMKMAIRNAKEWWIDE